MIQRIEQHTLTAARAGARQVALDGQGRIARAAPIDTGRLRGSIKGTGTSTADGAKVLFIADTPYAAVQDRGFATRGGKNVHFVNHPKGGGAGYMSTTFQSSIRGWQQHVANVMKAANR